MARLRRCTRVIRKSFSTKWVLSDCQAHAQGVGTLLMEEAERIAREEHGSGRIAVISGESLFLSF